MRITTGAQFSPRTQPAIFSTLSFPTSIKHEEMGISTELYSGGSFILFMSAQYSTLIKSCNQRACLHNAPSLLATVCDLILNTAINKSFSSSIVALNFRRIHSGKSTEGFLTSCLCLGGNAGGSIGSWTESVLLKESLKP